MEPVQLAAVLAGVIVGVMTAFVPRLAELTREGEMGRQSIERFSSARLFRKGRIEVIRNVNGARLCVKLERHLYLVTRLEARSSPVLLAHAHHEDVAENSYGVPIGVTIHGNFDLGPLLRAQRGYGFSRYEFRLKRFIPVIQLQSRAHCKA